MNKTKVILDYMLKGNYVSDKVAVELCYSYRLSAIIYVLRHDYEIPVQDRWRESQNGYRYKEYYIEKDVREYVLPAKCR